MSFNPTFTSESLFSSSSSSPNGAVSNDLIQYLLQIEPLFSSSPTQEQEQDEGESEEERQRLFLNNVLTEMSGQELNLSLHYDGSRIFEKFISSCQTYNQLSPLVTVCQALEPYLERLAVDRFGSHVLQALLRTVRPFIEREVVHQEEAEHEEPALILWVEQASRVLMMSSPNAASHLLTNEYGSHVLRSLLVTLIGRDLYCQVEEEGHAMSAMSSGSNGSRGRQLARKKNTLAESKWVYKIPTDRFSKLFTCFTDALSTVDVDTLKNWAFHQSASPVLQFLLIYFSVQENTSSRQPMLLDIFFDHLAMDASFFWKASRHKIASHFLQSLLRAMGRCSPKSYHSFYTRVIRANSSTSQSMAKAEVDSVLEKGLETLLLDPSGNFVLQSLVEYAPSPEFFHLLLGHLQGIKIGPNLGQSAHGKRGQGRYQGSNGGGENEPTRQGSTFSDLIALNRFGLFLKMIQASIRLKVPLEVQGIMSKVCLSMLKESTSDKLLPCLLSLNKQTVATTTATQFEYMGCLATTFLVTHYDPHAIKPLLDSILKCCTHAYLSSMAMNAYASFTLESIFRYSNAKIRTILVTRLLFPREGDELELKDKKDGSSEHPSSSTISDIFWRLATDKYGSHILQTIYEMSSLEEKSRCNDRLLPFQSMLQDNGGPTGRMTLQFTRLADYARRRVDWQATEHERQAKDRRAANLLDSVDLSLLTTEPRSTLSGNKKFPKQEFKSVQSQSQKQKHKQKHQTTRAELDEVDHIFQSVHGKKQKKHSS